MFRAIVGSLLAVILVLAVTTVVLWGQGQNKAKQFAQAESALAAEKKITTELRSNLSIAQETSEKLTEQLKNEREALQVYQSKTKQLHTSLLEQQEKIRILEREDKIFRDWGNDALPFSVIGLLNQADSGTSDRNSN